MALGLYGPEGLQWAGGGNAAGVQVFVYLPGTTTKIPLYLDDQGEFSLANPVMSDQTGRIAFYAEQGSYDLVINSTRFAINISDNIGDPPPKLVQLADVEVVNPTDGQSVVWESATSRWKNKMVAGGGGGAVSSVFGRTGTVVAQNGDYTPAQVGAAPVVHTHGTGDVTGLNAFVTAIANAAATAAVNAVIDAAPGSLDTLNEIAAALGDDPNFATTITNLIAGKQNADADLSAIAALAPADGSLIQRIAGVWNSQTTTQVKASMGLSNVDNTSDVDKPVSTAQAAADALRVPLSLFDAAGDLIVGSGDNTGVKLAKGADGTFLGVSGGSLGYFTPAGGSSGLKARTDTGMFLGTMGPCGIAGTWTVCPTAFRSLPITASANDILDWRPNMILGVGTATSDAEFDLATIDNSTPGAPVILRCLSSNTNTPLANGAGGMYCWQNNARRLPGVADWKVNSGDIVGGTVTFALLYRANASGLAIGHASVYPSRVTVLNYGPAAA